LTAWVAVATICLMPPSRSRLASRVALAAVMAVAACARPARPTIIGADLYAQVQRLQAAGEVELPAAPTGTLHVGTGHWLATATSAPQVFSVRELIAGCRGGDPEQDLDCTLALLGEQRFTVLTRPPAPARSVADPDDPDGADRAGVLAGVPPVVVGALVTGAIGAPLIYGLTVCEFPGCKVVFGLPLAFDAVALLLILAAL
jgi:hypothetical protein